MGFLSPYTKINSKWIKETIKLLEENIGRTHDDINQSKILYDPPPRVMEIKTKVNKCLKSSNEPQLPFYMWPFNPDLSTT